MKYREYSETQADWLPSVPAHWEQEPLKFVAPVVREKRQAAKSDDYFVGLEHIQSWTGKILPDDEAESEGIVSLFEAGDILFGKLRPYLAKVHLAERPGTCTSEALVIRTSEELNSSYLKYYMLSPSFIENVNGSTFGSKMPRANWEYIGSQTALIPPPLEQVSIVTFLDDKTKHIDELIQRKEELLLRLAEKRAAIITNAVTKGLNPNAATKDSGISWLGDIPEHWETRQLRHICPVVKTGNTPPSNGPDYFSDEGMNWFTPGDFGKDLKLTLANRKLDQLAERDGVVRVFPAGSVLLVGIGATLGKVGFIDEACTANQQINAVYPSEQIFPEYLSLYLSSIIQIVRMSSNASTLGILNQDKTKQLLCTLPPIFEQKQIAKSIFNYMETDSHARSKIKDAIVKLREYRSALITAAVTGQIEVAV